MGVFTDIDAAAAEHIASINQQSTDALALVASYMPTIEAISELMAPYFIPGTAEYTETQFDRSGVTTPSFTELSRADDALRGIDAQTLTDLSAGSTSLYPALKPPIDKANADLEAIWNDIKDTSTISFDEDAYVANIITEVQGKLENALSDPMGSSTATEAAYYSKDAVRRNAARAKDLDDTLGEFAGRGFALPAAVLSDLGSVVLQKQGMDEADRQRTVILQQSALSQDNKTRAIDAGLRYDQILITYFERKMQRAFQMATSGLKVIQDLADMKFYVLRERLGVQQSYFDLISENQRLIFSEFDQNAKGFEARMDALISQASGYLNAFSTEGQVYDLRERALNENRKFSVSEGEVKMDVLRWNLANALKAFAENTRAFMSTAHIRLNAAQTGSSVQIGVAEAANASISTIIGVLSSDKTTSSGA